MYRQLHNDESKVIKAQVGIEIIGWLNYTYRTNLSLSTFYCKTFSQLLSLKTMLGCMIRIKFYSCQKDPTYFCCFFSSTHWFLRCVLMPTALWLKQIYTQDYQCTSELFWLLSIWQYGRQKLTSNSLEEDFTGGSEVKGSPLWLYITSVGQELQILYWKISEPVTAAIISNNSSQIISLVQQPSAL